MCKKYVCTSDEWKKENKKYSNKFEIWSKIFGDDIQNIKDLFKIGDNLNARQKSGVPFPKGLTDDDARTIIYLSDWMAVQVFKPKQMGNFLGNEFLLKLKDDMQKAY